MCLMTGMRVMPEGPSISHEPEDVNAALDMMAANGFLAADVHIGDGVADVLAERIDEFGAARPYFVAFALNKPTPQMLESWRESARWHAASLVVVADDGPDDAARLSWSAFAARLGGVVPSALPLEPSYSQDLVALGRNRLPPEFTDGTAEEKYEVYVGAGLEFLLGSRVIRYGAQRRFEAVPDGLMLPHGERAAFLYDAKAYDPSFGIERDDLRRFADYTTRYNDRYAHHLGPVRAFMVVSTEFAHKIEARRSQSQRLLADAGVPLSFMKSADLAAIVARFAQRPWTRNSLRWTEILTQLEVTDAVVERALSELDRDGVQR